MLPFHFGSHTFLPVADLVAMAIGYLEVRRYCYPNAQ